MARVTLVKKARKDQGSCKCGTKIKTGDEYRWWQFRFGPRNVRCMKPECAPRGSDLTQSEFLSQLSNIEDSVSEALSDFNNGSQPGDLASALSTAADELRTLGEECQEKKDNMPEGLQEGDVGQLLEERASGCEEKADELESAASEIEQLELWDDVNKYLEDHPDCERGEKETEEGYRIRIQEEMEEANQDAREEAAGNVDTDLSIM